MKLNAYVIEDGGRDWEMNGQKGRTRTIVLLDRDQGETRLLQPLKLKIRQNDALAGKEGELRDAVIDVAITRFDQNERTKEITAEGHVLSVNGAMQYRERKAA